MNWTIGFFIWWKGIGNFSICCISFLEPGLRALSIGLLISWIAIPVYASSFWIIKKTRIPYKPSMSLMFLAPTVSSVCTTLYLLHLVDVEMVSDGESILFWIPLFCCIPSVTFSANRIYCFLHPEAVSEEFIIE